MKHVIILKCTSFYVKHSFNIKISNCSSQKMRDKKKIRDTKGVTRSPCRNNIFLHSATKKYSDKEKSQQYFMGSPNKLKTNE